MPCGEVILVGIVWFSKICANQFTNCSLVLGPVEARLPYRPSGRPVWLAWPIAKLATTAAPEPGWSLPAAPIACHMRRSWLWFVDSEQGRSPRAIMVLSISGNMAAR